MVLEAVRLHVSAFEGIFGVAGIGERANRVKVCGGGVRQHEPLAMNKKQVEGLDLTCRQ